MRVEVRPLGDRWRAGGILVAACLVLGSLAPCSAAEASGRDPGLGRDFRAFRMASASSPSIEMAPVTTAVEIGTVPAAVLPRSGFESTSFYRLHLLPQLAGRLGPLSPTVSSESFGTSAFDRSMRIENEATTRLVARGTLKATRRAMKTYFLERFAVDRVLATFRREEVSTASGGSESEAPRGVRLRLSTAGLDPTASVIVDTGKGSLRMTVRALDEAHVEWAGPHPDALRLSMGYRRDGGRTELSLRHGF